MSQATARVTAVDKTSTMGNIPLRWDVNDAEICDELTQIGHPGAGGGDGDQNLLVDQVERHGELAEDGDDGVGGGHQLPGHTVHANDEQPPCHPRHKVGGEPDQC